MSSAQDTTPSAEVFTLPVENRTFPRFPELLYDVRYMIWLEALSYERYLKITLNYPGDNTGSSRSYELELRRVRERMTEPIMHPLLQTCSESRQIAKMFYRIQFSCKYFGEDIYFKLYICPELDILDIVWEMPSYFIEFATDCYDQDRARKGLLNIVLPRPGAFNLDVGKFPIDKDAAKAAIRRLRRVILGGPVLFFLSFDQQQRASTRNPSLVPRLGRGITFDHLTTDPRGISELERLFVPGPQGVSGTESKWQRLLDMVGIDQSKCNFEESIMLSQGGGSRDRGEPRIKLPSVTGFRIVPLEAFKELGGSGTHGWVNLKDYPPELYVDSRS